MKRKVALVLGSGGARGVAHIGVIEALLDNGYEISSIAGSSMGAVVGGLYASNKMHHYKDWVTNFDKIDVFKLLDFTFSRQGFVRGEKVFREMDKLFGDFKIEDMAVPYVAVASNIRKQEEVLYTKGSLIKALRASCAIPTVMTPVYENNEEIVDGGVLNPIPINRVKRHDNDVVIAVNVNANIPYTPVSVEKAKPEPENNQQYLQFLSDFRGKIKNVWPYGNKETTAENDKEQLPPLKKYGIFDLLNRSIDLMQQQITTLNTEQYKPDVMIHISRESCGTFEFYRSNELVKIGYEAAEKALKNQLNAVS